jgi:hypothetical protein
MESNKEGIWHSVDIIQRMMNMFFTTNLQNQVEIFQSEGKQDVAMDCIYKTLDYGLSNGEYAIIDHFLKSLDINKFSRR